MTRSAPALWLTSCAAALVAACGPADAPAAEAEPQPAAVATAGVARPSITADEIAALDAALSGAVADKHAHGLAYLLSKDGETVAENRFGVQSLETGAPIAEDTLYRIYSMTKPITGVAMMMLYEAGAWSLDDPITKFVPELADLKVLAGVDEAGAPILVDAERAPTMRELMSHTAGFGYGLGGADPVNTAFREKEVLGSPDLETMVQRVADIPLLFQPGDDWFYSIAVDIQGLIVERISGQTFGDFLDERIFTPLGMDDTRFYVPDAERSRFSDVFAPDPETGALVRVDDPRVAFKEGAFGMESGGGGLVSTMDDYARFCQMMLNGGALDGARIITPETIALMTTNVLKPHMSMFNDGTAAGEPDGLGFGLDWGLVVDQAAGNTAPPEGTYYWGGAAGTWFWIDPVNDLYFIGMIQKFTPGPNDDTYDFRDVTTRLVYDALED